MQHKYITYRIRPNSFFARLAARKLGASQVAFVLGKTIHLFNTSREEFIANDRWLRHELCHIRQFKQHGFFRFIFLYLIESAKRGYYNNKFEAEARLAEDNAADFLVK